MLKYPQPIVLLLLFCCCLLLFFILKLFKINEVRDIMTSFVSFFYAIGAIREMMHKYLSYRNYKTFFYLHFFLIFALSI